MVKPPAPHNEALELDRRIDLVNVVFGAALGGYIGVVMTRRDLTLEHSDGAVHRAGHHGLPVGRDPQHPSYLARHVAGNVEAAAGGGCDSALLFSRGCAVTPISTSRC